MNELLAKRVGITLILNNAKNLIMFRMLLVYCHSKSKKFISFMIFSR
jgi:hypothetical protein